MHDCSTFVTFRSVGIKSLKKGYAGQGTIIKTVFVRQ